MRVGIPWLRLFAEGGIICASVLLALAADAWWDEREDESSESSYLTLLHRDLERIQDDLVQQIAFEQAQMRDGIEAYRGLSRPSDSLTDSERDELSGQLQRLVVRRTMVPRDATYRDLIGSGNLRLLDDPILRNRVVDFFERLRVRSDIINRNNQVFVDEGYGRTLQGPGLVLPRGTGGNLSDQFAEVEAFLAEAWSGGYIDEADRLWQLPRDGPEWVALKPALMTRTRISAYAAMQAERLLEETRDLLEVLEAEQGMRIPAGY